MLEKKIQRNPKFPQCASDQSFVFLSNTAVPRKGIKKPYIFCFPFNANDRLVSLEYGQN